MEKHGLIIISSFFKHFFYFYLGDFNFLMAWICFRQAPAIFRGTIDGWLCESLTTSTFLI